MKNAPRFLITLFALVVLVAVLYHPSASAQFPAGVCVMEAVTVTGPPTATNFNCENRTKFTAPVFTGQVCSPPSTGIMLYAKLPDGSCLPIQAVAAAGFTATNVQIWTEQDLNGNFNVESTYAKLIPCKSPTPDCPGIASVPFFTIK